MFYLMTYSTVADPDIPLGGGGGKGEDYEMRLNAKGIVRSFGGGN